MVCLDYRWSLAGQAQAGRAGFAALGAHLVDASLGKKCGARRAELITGGQRGRTSFQVRVPVLRRVEAPFYFTPAAR